MATAVLAVARFGELTVARESPGSHCMMVMVMVSVSLMVGEGGPLSVAVTCRVKLF